MMVFAAKVRDGLHRLRRIGDCIDESTFGRVFRLDGSGHVGHPLSLRSALQHPWLCQLL